jgi:C4-dicarboxylate transporter, DctM subunit
MPEGSLPISEEKKVDISGAHLPTKLVEILSKIERIGGIISGGLILIMMLMTTIDVIMRYVFNHPMRGNYEIQPVLLIGVTYLAAASVQARRLNITMDLITSHLSKANQSAIRLFSDTIFLISAAIICWKFAVNTWIAWGTGDYILSMIKVPLWPPYLIITLGTGLLALRLSQQLISNPLWSKKSEIGFKGRFFRALLVVMALALILTGILIAREFSLSAIIVGVIIIAMFMVLMLLGTPVGSTLMIITLIGFWILSGGSSALGIAASIPYSAVGQYTLTVLPLFTIMGSFAAAAGFADEGFNLAKRWLERIPGGIIHATVIGATAFGAASGSGAAACVVLSKIAIPEMLKQGVSKGMAIGVVASAGTLAMMIPPSGAFVVYGMLTGNSVGKLLIAGIIPGLIGAVMIMIMVAIRCKLDPVQAGSLSAIHTSWKERFTYIPKAWGLLFIAVVVMGGLWVGIFTPTEAGAVGAFAAFVAVIALRKLNFRSLYQYLFESGDMTAQILLILLGGLMFSYFMSITRLPAQLSELIAGIDVAPIIVIIIIMVFYVVLGCFLDDMSILIATIPIVYPIILKLGYDPIWFGVLVVQQINISVVTPPYGMNLFMMKAILGDTTTMGEIFRAVLWFIVPLILTLAIYIVFPQVCLWLPGMMK